MTSRVITLSNEIPVIYTPVYSTRLAYCAFVFNVGSRDELPDQIGLAHFTEHMLFKGTTKRKAYHILNRIDSIGGELNAYTSKEKTCYYAITLSEYLNRSIELLWDISYHSIFPENEIEKEKTVIADEIDMYKDNPEDTIQEEFESLVFANHPLGNPILGTSESINSFNSGHLFQFTQDHYSTNLLAISIAGNFSLKQTQNYLEKIIASHSFSKKSAPKKHRLKPNYYQPFLRKSSQNYQQSCLIVGGRAPSFNDEYFYCLQLLNYYLGGPAMNSRLNLNVREKYGLTYNIYSFFNPYIDSGIWGVFASCDKKTIDKTIALIQKELSKIKKGEINAFKLAQIKKQFIGYLIMSNESLSNQMLTSAKDVLDFEKVYSVTEAVSNIEKITVDDIINVSNLYFQDDKLSYLIYESA